MRDRYCHVYVVNDVVVDDVVVDDVMNDVVVVCHVCRHLRHQHQEALLGRQNPGASVADGATARRDDVIALQPIR